MQIKQLSMGVVSLLAAMLAACDSGGKAPATATGNTDDIQKEVMARAQETATDSKNHSLYLGNVLAAPFALIIAAEKKAAAVQQPVPVTDLVLDPATPLPVIDPQLIEAPIIEISPTVPDLVLAPIPPISIFPKPVPVDPLPIVVVPVISAPTIPVLTKTPALNAVELNATAVSDAILQVPRLRIAETATTRFPEFNSVCPGSAGSVRIILEKTLTISRTLNAPSSITLQYDDFCIGDVTATGEATLKIVRLDTGFDIKIEFANLALATPEGVFHATGEGVLTFSNNRHSVAIVINATLNGADARTVAFTDFTFGLNLDGDTLLLSMSGKITDSLLGEVDVTTEIPFDLAAFDAKPSVGSMSITTEQDDIGLDVKNSTAALSVTTDIKGSTVKLTQEFIW